MFSLNIGYGVLNLVRDQFSLITTERFLVREGVVVDCSMSLV